MTALLGGAFLVASSLGFGSATVSWLGLGVGALVVCTVACAFLFRGRGRAQRAFDGATALAGAWTIVASRAFAGAGERWLMFSCGALLAALAVQALAVHEANLEAAVRLAARRGAFGVGGTRMSDGRSDGVRERPGAGAGA